MARGSPATKKPKCDPADLTRLPDAELAAQIEALDAEQRVAGFVRPARFGAAAAATSEAPSARSPAVRLVSCTIGRRRDDDGREAEYRCEHFTSLTPLLVRYASGHA